MNTYKNRNLIKEAMTAKEVKFKRNVLQYMREEGFPKFADYMQEFHFNFLNSAQAGYIFIAAIDPEHGVIYINPTVNADAISLILRHEAGHHIFKHHEHLIQKLKDIGIDSPSELAYKLANKAGDYHISNYLYDKDDYITATNISTDDAEKLVGLVTELDFPENPEYWTMDFDQLWDVFVKDYDPKVLAQSALSEDFIQGWNKAVEDFNSGKISRDDIIKYVSSIRK